MPFTTTSSGTMTGINEHNEGMGIVVRGTACKCPEHNNLPARMMIVESYVKIIMIVGLVLYLMSFKMSFSSKK